MSETLYGDDFAFSARILGALFTLPPDNPQIKPVVDAFLSGDWQSQWPLAEESLTPLAQAFMRQTDEPVEAAWQRLFIGPWALPAPPWGSVWLDKESVLFGDSTLALRQWMRDNHIVWETQENVPEDHFGTLLMLAAWLAENQNEHACNELLAWHILPWSERFLEVFVQEAHHPFWQSLGILAQKTLADWQSKLSEPVAHKTLYR
ncbi:Tat proofreading chaperone DmsD [Yokenella regensburgei]|uniref:Tat proofreading chaperone DmsD n=1 Tax=Yokenella regensburgei TaxID=158877 RepID=UPI003F136457